METPRTTFAVLFGNRGFFPTSLIASARTELCETLQRFGHQVLMMDIDATRHDAVETPEEGRKFAQCLAKNRSNIDGVILSLPTFGDKNSVFAALRDAHMPILIHAYSDSLEAMGPSTRRDSFCGKLSIMDVLCQNRIPFTAIKPHVVHPHHPEFARNIDHFARLCGVVRGMQEQFGVSPCVLLSEMNDRSLPAACKLDTGSAVLMYAMRQASNDVAACLDWNNNCGDDEDKCILFHCGPVPQRMMTRKGAVVDHSILVPALGHDRSYGCNVGRIAPTPFTFGGLLTQAGRVEAYLGEADFTDDPIPDDFFGCARGNADTAVAGHTPHDWRHRTSPSHGTYARALRSAIARSPRQVPRF